MTFASLVVARATLRMRSATLREMGSVAPTRMRRSSRTLTARARPMCGTLNSGLVVLPFHTWWRRSMASKVSWNAMPSARMPMLAWNSRTAASVWGP